MVNQWQQRCWTNKRNLLVACERSDFLVGARTHTTDKREDLILTIQVAQTRRHIRAAFGEMRLDFTVVDTTTRVQFFEVCRDDLAHSLAYSGERSIGR